MSYHAATHTLDRFKSARSAKIESRDKLMISSKKGWDWDWDWDARCKSNANMQICNGE